MKEVVPGDDVVFEWLFAHQRRVDHSKGHELIGVGDLSGVIQRLCSTVCCSVLGGLGADGACLVGDGLDEADRESSCEEKTDRGENSFASSEMHA